MYMVDRVSATKLFVGIKFYTKFILKNVVERV